MYKAVFLDLDGTLLDDKKNISKENLSAIKNAQENGAFVCICTGRQIDIANNFRKQANADKYLISSNGTVIYDCENNEELFFSSLPDDICLELYNYVQKNNILIRVDTTYARYLNNMNLRVSTEIELEEDFEKFIRENKVVQISICSQNEENIYEIINCIKEKRSDIKIENKFKTTINGENYTAINIINSNASKGNAIAGLCKFLKIDLKDVIAIGDDLNDISMINMVGLGVAMKNGTDELKKCAKEITKTNNENGVAEILNLNFKS